MPETLYIIDGHSQMYRAYYAPFRQLTSPTGEPTRATYVFSQMLLSFIQDRRPDYLAMAIDGPAARLKAYAEYKVTRKPMPEDLHPQVERICQIVRAMGIPVLEAEGYEADDILATAVERLVGDDLRAVLISRDKDLDQLVGPNVTLHEPMTDETLDAETIRETKGYPPEKAVEVQTLTGDSSDNIPGVPGVGPKTAVKLINKYGTVDEVVAHADELTPKLRENLLANAETLEMSRELVTLDRDVPIELDLDAMRFDGIDGDAIRPIFAELGFERLLEQLDRMGVDGANAVDVDAVAAAGGQTAAGDFAYECVSTSEGLRELAGKLSGVKRIAVDTETTSVRALWAELVGVSVAFEPGKGYYLPVKAPLGEPTLDVDEVREALGSVLTDPNVEKIGHNLKYDLLVLEGAGFEVGGPMFDTMIAAHVLDSSRNTFKLDALAMECLNHRCIPIEEVIGRGRNQITMDAAPLEIVAPYAAEDADVALRLAEVLRRRVADEGLTRLFGELETPLLRVLADMEREGIRVDPQALKRMETELSKQADVLRDRILAAAGVDFNVDSPKQLGEVLFQTLGLRIIKRTKTGPSTDSSVLAELAAEHELPGMVLDYRKLTKLLSTYVKALGECIHPETGRVHTSFHQVATVTGRLSSSDPNLQNIPIRTEEGRRIRSAFVADEGCVLLSADYSQVELRVLAHLCEDPTLIQAFHDDLDIHRLVAAEVFGAAIGDVSPEQRARAKGVNFGIIYGQTAWGLAGALRIGRTEAQEFIDAYHARFPRIREFLDACIRQAKSQGYVETIFKRRRAITEIDSRNPQRRALAERLAINSVVQGSAADLIKQAMVNLARRIGLQERPSRMLLQIHDELVFECPRHAVDTERDMVVEEMSGAIELRVPLKVDTGVGENWMDAK